MLMSVIARSCEPVALPELKGARVLITGLTPAFGFDIARAFADHGAHLVIQSPDDSPEMTELAAVLAESSSEMRLFTTALDTNEAASRFMQSAAQDAGGFDVVVNLVTIGGASRLESADDVEDMISDALFLPLRLTEVAANRMRLVWAEGGILNVVRMADAAGGRAMMLADMLRAELSDLTRGLARQWTEQGIRINAVAPPTSIAAMGGEGQASEADVAAIALQLASRKGRSVSGHVLDAAGAARRWC